MIAAPPPPRQAHLETVWTVRGADAAAFVRHEGTSGQSDGASPGVKTATLLASWYLPLFAAVIAAGTVCLPLAVRADDLISAPGADPGDTGTLSLGLEYDGASSIHSPTALGLFAAGYDLTPHLSLGADLLLSKGTRRTNVLSPNGSYLILTSKQGLRARAGMLTSESARLASSRSR